MTDNKAPRCPTGVIHRPSKFQLLFSKAWFQHQRIERTNKDGRQQELQLSPSLKEGLDISLINHSLSLFLIFTGAESGIRKSLLLLACRKVQADFGCQESPRRVPNVLRYRPMNICEWRVDFRTDLLSIQQ
jgi:hypothetical protein